MMLLSNSALASLPGRVRLPPYDRAAVKTGVVHLGVGAFHRAHQAVVFDDALSAGDLRWGVLGASLRSPDVAAQLNPQDGLYTVISMDGASSSKRVIGAIRAVQVGQSDSAALAEAMAHRDVHLVTLTVTEKGYCLDPATGELRGDDPAVAHDIAAPNQPQTAIGFLTAALALRRARGIAPFTVISCDNLPQNGARTQRAVLSLAAMQNCDLAKWIADEVAFPSTMVDRIVPATTAEDIQALSSDAGYTDHGMVKTEPFFQWVVEDRFCSPRPEFARFGVQLTQNVSPYEEAKLRLLNGSHSAIAYLGGLAGHAFVADAMSGPGFSAFVNALMDEAATSLDPPADLDLASYRAALIARFRNSALNHGTRQIAMDGSQKLPQRILESVRARLRSGLPFPALALAVAGWMRWQLGRDEAGAPYAVDDPLSERTADLLRGADIPEAMVSQLLSVSSVFGTDLPSSSVFVRTVSAALKRLLEDGAAKTVAAFESPVP